MAFRYMTISGAKDMAGFINPYLKSEFQIQDYDFDALRNEVNSLGVEIKHYELKRDQTITGTPIVIELQESWFVEEQIQ